MSTTKKLTLSALMAALGTALMVLGVYIDVAEMLDLSLCAIASLFVVFIYLEIGSYYPWLVWICTSLATALLASGKPIWAEYLLVFGIYPLIKAYIERLPKWSWLIIKLVYINATVWAIFFISELLIGQNLLFEEGKIILSVLTYILINVAFLAYDKFIVVMVRFYIVKIRPRFAKFLK